MHRRLCFTLTGSALASAACGRDRAVAEPEPIAPGPSAVIDPKIIRVASVRPPSRLGAYMLQGLTPSVRATGKRVPLEPRVLADPLLQRMLISVIVKPTPHATNVDGARALQSFLLLPATQAAIRAIKYPGAETVTWVPAGRHNRSGMLPKG